MTTKPKRRSRTKASDIQRRLKPKIAGRELNPNELAFVKAFAATNFTNATSSYREAYPSSQRWQDSAVTSNAWQVQQRPHVAEAIEDNKRVRARSLEEAQRRYAISKDSIASELASIAFADPGDYATWDEEGKVTFTPSHKLTRRQRASIIEIRRTPEGYVSLKQEPKRGALMDLARLGGILGMDPPEKSDDDNPELTKVREDARKQMIDLLNKFAVPEPLVIDGKAE